MANGRSLRPRTRQSASRYSLPQRLSRLLNTGHKKFTTRELYAQNASQSPLLNIPPEVRNLIFRLVLGNRTIHVATKICCHEKHDEHFFCNDEKFYCNVCQAEESDGCAAKTIRDAAEGQPLLSYEKRHAACVVWHGQSAFTRITPCDSPLDLRLLLVCSQIHAEAALIPFQLNTFSFLGSMPGFPTFAMALNPAQRRAIRTLSLWAVPSPASNLKRLLPGLKQLLLFYEGDSSGVTLRQIESELTKYENGADRHGIDKKRRYVFAKSDFASTCASASIVCTNRSRQPVNGTAFPRHDIAARIAKMFEM